MGRVQLSVTLEDAEIGEIVTFLGTLTGALQRISSRRQLCPRLRPDAARKSR